MLRSSLRASFIALVVASGACASGDLMSPPLQNTGDSNSIPSAQPTPVGSGSTTGGATTAGTTGGAAAGTTTGAAGATTGGGASTAGGTGGATTGGTAASTAPYTYVGRFDMTDPNAPVFGLLGSRIGATFTGTSINATFLSTGLNFFNVSIDGGPASIVAVNPNTSKQVIPMATGLANAEHTIWISKRTEFLQATVSNVQFFGYTFSSGGAFGVPPTVAARRVEFSGDSGFTGYGVDQLMTGPSDYCSFTEATQNADKSIPAYTGSYLNADIVNNSASGQAVYQSVYDSNPNHLLPFLYNETTPPNNAPRWDFSKWTADVVVLDGGGDDLAGDAGVGTFPNQAGFVSAYESWVAGVRASYPKATIVVVLSQAASGGDVTTLGGALQQVVADRNNAGDPNVFYFDFYTYPTSDPNYQTYDDIATKMNFGYGCSYHPSDAGSQWLAKRLAAFIQSKMGW